MNVCFYHRSDLDGHCGGAIYARAMKEAGVHLFVLHGMEYGDEIPWDLIDGNNVTIIDWSFQPWIVFEEVIRRAKHVTWIDHHKSAIDSSIQSWCLNSEKLATRIDIQHSGCELAWKHYFPRLPMPLAVYLLGRYDVWDHAVDGRILPFQYRMRMEITDPLLCESKLLWDTLLGPTEPAARRVAEYVAEGRIILRYQEQQDERELNAIAFDLKWNDMVWLACNRTGKSSAFFQAKWDSAKYHGMMAFGWTGRHWRIGLYSDRPDVDCADIAKVNGGGGHKGAAGFQSQILPFQFGI